MAEIGKDDQSVNVCPKCQTVANIARVLKDSSKDYCPNCGYDFNTGRMDFRGPINFLFPKVSNAYEPSGRCNVSACKLMLIHGFLAAIIGGVLLYFIKKILLFLWTNLIIFMANNKTISAFVSEQLLLELLITFGGLIIIFGLADYFGTGLAGIIGDAAKEKKCRNVNVARFIGFFTGIVGCLAFYITYNLFGRILSENFESITSLIDIMLLIEPIVLMISSVYIIVITAHRSGQIIEKSPFCETCDKYLSNFIWEKIPIRFESILMERLNSCEFNKLIEMPILDDIKDYCRIGIWFCESCWNKGFINVETIQSRMKQSYKKNEYATYPDYEKFELKTTETRLVYSAHIGHTEIDKIQKSGVLENVKCREFILSKSYDLALNCYEKSIEMCPQNAEAWNGKGFALEGLGRNAEAEVAFDKAIKINPQYAEFWYNKSEALKNQGKHDEAIKCFDNVTKALDEAIKSGLDDALLISAFTFKGLALNNMGKYDESIRCFDEIIKLDTNDALAWCNKGEALKNQGKYDEAIKCLDNAILIKPSFIQAWINNGIALYKQGKHDEAIKCFDETLRIDPNNYGAWLNKGIVLTSHSKYDEAIKCFNEAHGRERELNLSAEALNSKGKALYHTGKHDDALTTLDQAIKLDPQYAETWNNKGVVLQSLDRISDAEAAFAKAKELGYTLSSQ